MPRLVFEDLLRDSDAAPLSGEEIRYKPAGLRCECGRFAKFMGDQHYYNGTYDCYRYTVRCSRCGDVDVECV